MAEIENFRTWGRQRCHRLTPSEDQGRVVHVTIGTYDHRAAFLDPGLAHDVFQHATAANHTLAACLMPDHFHWLVRVEMGSDLSGRIGRFKSETTRIGWRRGRRGRLWQRSFFDRVVRHEEDLLVVARYIVENPGRAGVATTVEEYPFCGVFRKRFPDR